MSGEKPLIAEEQRVRWCPEAGTWQPEDDPVCAWTDHSHRLRLRRMLVCIRCEQAYFSRKDFDAHECFDAY